MNNTFSPSDPHVLFGEVDIGDGFYMPLIPENHHEYILRIDKDYSLLLDLALAIVLGSYSIYEDYSLSPKRWSKILLTCDTIVNAESFDNIFEYVTEANYEANTLGNDYMLYFINNNGKIFWDNIGTYKSILSDIKKWTALFCRDTKINVLGL